jgi:hypothetical protein
MTVELYRQNADRCRLRSLEALTPEGKDHWLRIAEGWEKKVANAIDANQGQASRPVIMKTAEEYLDLAVQFELLARFEENLKLKADFEKQAAAYRQLAANRMDELGPNPPKISN